MSRPLLLLGPLLALGLIAGLNAVLQPWTLDDAYISYRYAENLAAGHGPVYNPGERVEGYTTPLWVALLAAGHALGADTRTLSKVLGGLFAGFTVLALSGSHRAHRELSPEGGAVAALLLGGCTVFGAWVMPGMEVPLVAFLVSSTLLATLRELDRGDAGWHAGVVGALALTSRPDAVVTVGVAMGALVLAAATRRDARLLRGPLALLALYGPFFAARWGYYGWPLPNTFYAKVGSTGEQVARGLEYARGFLVPAAPLLVASALARRGTASALLAVACVAHGAYVVAVGGDVMPAYRFFAHVLPLLALLAAQGLGRWPAAAWPVALGAVLWGLVAFEQHEALHPRIRKGFVGLRGEEVGLWMREHLPPDTLLATNTAGSVPYFSRLRTIDMLGLNDAHIAHREMPNMGAGKAGHEKADGAYVFARAPDVVLMGSARGSAQPMFRSDRELIRQPGFRQRYTLRTVRLPSGGKLVYWERNRVGDARDP